MTRTFCQDIANLTESCDSTELSWQERNFKIQPFETQGTNLRWDSKNSDGTVCGALLH